jgi:GTP-binding protein Era
MKELRAAFIGLVGFPNSGKSTVFNSLVDSKISIVSAKPQTTRKRVLGIVNDDKSQLIFVDAPGFFEGSAGLSKFIGQEAKDVVESSDLVLGVISLDTESKEHFLELLNRLEASHKPFAILITKLDLSDYLPRKTIIRDLVQKMELKTAKKIPVFEYSNQWGKDCRLVRSEILEWAASQAPHSAQRLFDQDLYTPHTLRQLCEEIVREKCFEELSQEIPYSLTVSTNKFDESDPKCVRIYQDIIVSKENHKPIVIGQGGSKIKSIGSRARSDIEDLIGGKVFLSLDVKVKEAWHLSDSTTAKMGYEKNES